MAGKGIRIPLIADVAAFITGMRKAEVSAEDLADALDDMAADGIQGQQRLQRELEQTAREARKAGDKTAEGVKGSRLGEVGGEIGEEFTQNFGESVRSGDPAGAVLETFTSLGPAFGVAGIAVAAGAGLVNSVIQGANERKEAFAEAVKTIASSAFDAAAANAAEAGVGMVAAFQKAWDTKAVQEDSIRDALGVDSAQAALEEIARIANLTGVPLSTVREAILGQADAVSQVEGALAAATREAERQYDAAGVVAQADADRVAALERVLDGERAVTEAKDKALTASKAADVLNEKEIEDKRLAAKHAGDLAGAAERQARALSDSARYSALIAEDSAAWAANLAAGEAAARRAAQAGGYGSSGLPVSRYP